VLLHKTRGASGHTGTHSYSSHPFCVQTHSKYSTLQNTMLHRDGMAAAVHMSAHTTMTPYFLPPVLASDPSAYPGLQSLCLYIQAGETTNSLSQVQLDSTCCKNILTLLPAVCPLQWHCIPLTRSLACQRTSRRACTWPPTS
jgi:hypothetical protein